MSKVSIQGDSLFLFFFPLLLFSLWERNVRELLLAEIWWNAPRCTWRGQYQRHTVIATCSVNLWYIYWKPFWFCKTSGPQSLLAKVNLQLTADFHHMTDCSQLGRAFEEFSCSAAKSSLFSVQSQLGSFEFLSLRPRACLLQRHRMIVGKERFLDVF